ncbi:phenylalanine--tRNA ligase subunit beta [Corynebacterium yudongzhengii]|uniref:Phenylalanine--tRNA ligase beta subunit n=1 Tax=Corynebacterium yudongzhengii TaxID=2080740 RepID=A0A2U1T608_9CORY|nr:phenylalanine--tRNA ligase subunit beta [Corynebacterium yudongzhengii]AWB81976.1 phenylalanine--tRNA ligase subunit beta [Corynebacterium yudongzhengii]PWC01437.1 phenylalanine--tRNA ligase subunit beta [Corynebacterium yudongzhengii]
MYIAQNWLTGLLQLMDEQHSDWSVSAEGMDAGFVSVGFETEGYEPIPETTGDLVLGRVVEIEELTGFKKPIRYCQVDVGEANGTGENQGIICGARNFAEGDLVIVALPGTVLPGGFEISARKTYDHISAGMICSAAELGLTDKQNSGIIVISENEAGDAQPGDDAREIAGLADTVFEVNITPDRGYALSARGLTRELASAFDLTYTDPAQDPTVAGIDLAAVPEPQAEVLDLEVREETKAQRFGLRKVTGIDPSVESPYWLQRELMLTGARPVNAATDVTNYVMFLLGTPMHAFDAAQITGGLTVRNAEEGESFETLDHVERTLSAEDVVICDETGIQSLAGVMGGTTSEISESTTDVYFESVVWDPRAVARTSRRHKLSSESSRRFERGVDPALVETALDYACALLVAIAGGTVTNERSLYGDIHLAEPIDLRPEHPSELIGVDYERETIVRRLEEIGARVVDRAEVLAVTPPTWRTDISMPEDLIEEVVRLDGLDKVVPVLPTPRGGRGLTAAQRRRRAVGHALAYQGYTEILPSPFIKNTTFDDWGLDAADEPRKTVAVRNPLDSDYAQLGTTLLPAMLEAVERNVARGRGDLSLYGVQQVAFRRADASPMPDVTRRPSEETVRELVETLPHQPLHVATVGVGEIDATGPWGEGRRYTWAEAVESARIVARACGVELEVANAEQLPWHPGRCAQLKVADEVVGYAGELHPQVLENLGLPERTCAMELNLDAVPASTSLPAPVLSSFPALHQDIALVVDEDTPAETVRRIVEKGAGDLVESVELFDIFRGEQLGEGKKSLALKLLFRADDRTLTDEEANEHRLAAAELAEKELGATMRA